MKDIIAEYVGHELEPELNDVLLKLATYMSKKKFNEFLDNAGVLRRIIRMNDLLKKEKEEQK